MRGHRVDRRRVAGHLAGGQARSRVLHVRAGSASAVSGPCPALRRDAAVLPVGRRKSALLDHARAREVAYFFASGHEVHVLGARRAIFVRRRTERAHDRVPDHAARQLEVLGGSSKVTAELDAPDERPVERAIEVRGQDADAREPLDLLEQEVDLHVGVAVGRGLRLGRTRRKQRVGLVEEQHRVADARLLEDRADVLLGLADPLRDDLRDVDPVERAVELAGDDLGAQRLAGTGRAVEEHRDALAGHQLLAEAPAVEHRRLIAHRGDDLADLLVGLVGQDDVLDAQVRRRAHREVFERVAQLRRRSPPRAAPSSPGCRGFREREVHRDEDRVLDGAAGEIVRVGEDIEVDVAVQGHARRQVHLPDLPAQVGVGDLEGQVVR